MPPSHAFRAFDQTLHLVDTEPANQFISRCLKPFIIRQANPFRRGYEFFLDVLLLYIGLFFPYRLAFITFRLRESNDPSQCDPPSEPMAWIVWDWIVLVFFWTNLFINFLFTYRNRYGEEVVEPVDIANNYLRTMFFLNLIACLPSEAFSPLMSALDVDPGGCGTGAGTANEASRLVRLQRLVRLSRLSRLLMTTRLLKPLAKFVNKFGGRGMRLLLQVLVLMWIVHLMACGWYLCAAMHEDHLVTWVARREIIPDDGRATGKTLLSEAPVVQWWHSMYFILTIFTTVGFGDISAFTVGEISYVVVVMLVGAVVNGIIVGEVINVVNDVDKGTVWKRNKQLMLASFGIHTQLPDELVTNLSAFVQGLGAKGSTYDGNSRLRHFLTSVILPRQLLGRIPQQLFKGLLVKSKFLKAAAITCAGEALPPRFTLLIATMLTPQSFLKGEVVYQRNDHAFDIYLVLKGVFSFVRGFDSRSEERKTTLDLPRRSQSSAGVTSQFTSRVLSGQHSAKACAAWLGETCVVESPPEHNRAYSSNDQGWTSSAWDQESSAWRPATTDQRPWLEMDLGTVKPVSGIILRGHPSKNEWVTSFHIRACYTMGAQWHSLYQVPFDGLSGRLDRVEITFGEGVVVPARLIRIEAVSWHGRASMRAGVIVNVPKLYPYQLKGGHSFFGGEALVGTVREGSVQCERDGQALLLHRNKLLESGTGTALLVDFPQFREPLRIACINDEMKRRRMLAKCKSSLYDFKGLAVTAIQRHFREWKSTKNCVVERGASPLLNQLVVQQELHGRFADTTAEVVSGALSPSAAGEDGPQGVDAAFETEVLSLVQGLSSQVGRLAARMESLQGQMKDVRAALAVTPNAVPSR